MVSRALARRPPSTEVSWLKLMLRFSSLIEVEDNPWKRLAALRDKVDVL